MWLITRPKGPVIIFALVPRHKQFVCSPIFLDITDPYILLSFTKQHNSILQDLVRPSLSTYLSGLQEDYEKISTPYQLPFISRYNLPHSGRLLRRERFVGTQAGHRERDRR
jgi:hypothetical protein